MSGPYVLAVFVDAESYGEVNGDATVSSIFCLSPKVSSQIRGWSAQDQRPPTKNPERRFRTPFRDLALDAAIKLVIHAGRATNT
jgi:hypothetical protein